MPSVFPLIFLCVWWQNFNSDLFIFFFFSFQWLWGCTVMASQSGVCSFYPFLIFLSFYYSSSQPHSDFLWKSKILAVYQTNKANITAVSVQQPFLSFKIQQPLVEIASNFFCRCEDTNDPLPTFIYCWKLITQQNKTYLFAFLVFAFFLKKKMHHSWKNSQNSLLLCCNFKMKYACYISFSK